MHDPSTLMNYLVLWLIVIVLFYLFYKLTVWARKRKKAAYIFGAAVQMFLPDPYAERTIKIVQEKKAEVKKRQQGIGTVKD